MRHSMMGRDWRAELRAFGTAGTLALVITSLRAEFLREDFGAIAVLERDPHALRALVDVDLTEELEPSAGRQVRLARVGRFLEDHRRPEGVVECAGSEGPRVQRAGNELPERLEVLKHRHRRIVVVRGAVVYVSREPDHVFDLR